MSGEASWGLPRKVLFRCAFSYFLLLLLPEIIATIFPFARSLLHAYDEFCHAVVLWIAAHLLSVTADLPYFGAEVNDTQAGWILLCCYIVLAMLMALVWSVLDRNRTNYGSLQRWLLLLLRLSLAFTLIRYGALKFIPTQMIAPPPLAVLGQRVGELTRMRLLWVFMGASPLFESLTGLLELLAGMLLLIPRTILLGALLAAADMGMVFALNICYDVPVKLSSFHLLLIAILLVLPEIRLLSNVFVLGSTSEPYRVPRLFARKRTERAIQIAVLMAGCYAISAGLFESYNRYKQFHPPELPFYGVWSVEKFVFDGQEISMNMVPERWRWVTFQRPAAVTVELMIGLRKPYAMELDHAGSRMKLRDVRNITNRSAPDASFHFSNVPPDILVLDGDLNGKPAHVELVKMALSHEFHWIFVPLKEEDK